MVEKGLRSSESLLRASGVHSWHIWNGLVLGCVRFERDGSVLTWFNDEVRRAKHCAPEFLIGRMRVLLCGNMALSHTNRKLFSIFGKKRRIYGHKTSHL